MELNALQRKQLNIIKNSFDVVCNDKTSGFKTISTFTSISVENLIKWYKSNNDNEFDLFYDTKIKAENEIKTMWHLYGGLR